MSGVIDDVTSVFSDVFGGGSDAASAASDVSGAVSDASNVASAANDIGSSVPSGFNFASDAAGNLASSGTAINNAASYLDNAAAASYTAGVATGSWGSLDTGSSFASDIGSNPYMGIDNGQFNAGEFGSMDPNVPAYTNMALSTVDNGASAAQANVGHSWYDSAKSFFGLSGTGGTAAGGLTGGMSDLSKLMLGQMVGNLVSGVVQAGGAYLASKPRPPANFSGRTPGGGGGGLGMHAVNGGFGLAAGGNTAPPSGVPDALRPNPQAERLGGSGGLAPQTPPTGQPPNIAQTVANSAGVGGLIPQGSINFMAKGQGNG